jgi:hypothetical protein
MKSTHHNIDFSAWFSEWYVNNGIDNKINIAFSLPSPYMLPTIELPIDKVIFLDVVDKIDQNINVEPYLKEILDKSDEYGLIIFLEAIPRYNHILDNESKKLKITTPYLIDYFSKFGFRSVGKTLMMRKSNILENA